MATAPDTPAAMGMVPAAATYWGKRGNGSDEQGIKSILKTLKTRVDLAEILPPVRNFREGLFAPPQV